jgi:DNA modification methylase|tara:strand:+ start:1871 stop:2749 length:879 start_codon:yes stop_codon:yes gene_type:complete
MENKDLFGEVVVTNPLLRERFIEPPFSILDTKSGNWQRRKKLWKNIGMKSEVGRDATTFNMKDWADKKREQGLKGHKLPSDTSIFDPALCEVLYHWFVPKGGTILDPFAGGSVRGIVANYLDFKYTGIDIRQEQVDSNREQALDILDVNNQPQWYVGDSNLVLDNMTSNKYDLVFSCPPYADLEVYSDMDGDISNMPYEKFMKAYEEIINKSCDLVKKEGYAIFVVGEVRDKKGNYIGFVPDTIKAFKKAGMHYYNEGILLNSIASASMRANGNMKSKKLVKIHQNILIFRK